MEEKGFCYITDILVFSLLISTAILLLAAASPTDPETESARYAASFAQSAIQSMRNSTADQFGGFSYKLGAFGFELDLPVVGGSAKRELDNKTLAQLLAEDALLNLHLEVGGTEITILHPNQEMDENLREFLKSALDKTIGGRFGYRLRARTEPINLEFVRAHFETEISNLTQGQTKLCSETALFSLPVSREQLVRHIEKVSGIFFWRWPEVGTILEVNLELWSR